MKDDRMRPFVAFVSIFGCLGLYSHYKAYRLSRDGMTWKPVEPQSLLHGIVISPSRFLERLPSQAEVLPDPWRKLVARPKTTGRIAS